jgi:hypothetical protein
VRDKKAQCWIDFKRVTNISKCNNEAAIKQTNTLTIPKNIPFCIGDIWR